MHRQCWDRLLRLTHVRAGEVAFERITTSPRKSTSVDAWTRSIDQPETCEASPERHRLRRKEAWQKQRNVAVRHPIHFEFIPYQSRYNPQDYMRAQPYSSISGCCSRCSSSVVNLPLAFPADHLTLSSCSGPKYPYCPKPIYPSVKISGATGMES